MSPKNQQAAQRAPVPDSRADLAWFKAHPDRRHRVRPATKKELGLLDPAMKPGPASRYVAMRYEPGSGRLKREWLSAKSSVGELDESDARKAFRAPVWKAPAAGYAKRGEEEKAVLCAGTGRGFVVETNDKTRYVLMVAHCLPKINRRDLPPAHPGRRLEECTYKKVLAPLGKKPAVPAQCLFVDPISDLAILGQPDEELFEVDAYDALVEGRPALKVSQRSVEYDHSPDEGAPASLLSLEGHWFSCTVHPRVARLEVTAAAQRIQSGMSGSPILNADGDAIGAVSTGAHNPRLLDALPGWFLAKAVRGAVFARRAPR